MEKDKLFKKCQIKISYLKFSKLFHFQKIYILETIKNADFLAYFASNFILLLDMQKRYFY